MKILNKLFCCHKWTTHIKKSQVSNKVGVFNTIKREYTLEILICEHCGKIKNIEY